MANYREKDLKGVADAKDFKVVILVQMAHERLVAVITTEVVVSISEVHAPNLVYLEQVLFRIEVRDFPEDVGELVLIMHSVKMNGGISVTLNLINEINLVISVGVSPQHTDFNLPMAIEHEKHGWHVSQEAKRMGDGSNLVV